VDADPLAVELRPIVARAGVPGALADLTRFLVLLAHTNERVNLVSRRSTERDLAAHVEEALTALPLLPRAGFRLLDIGSGGGFPAIPLLLVRRDAQGTLVESIGKKADALASFLEALAMTGQVVRSRFPDLPKPMIPFEVMTSRAVADPLGLAWAARPYMMRGGRALLWTTRDVLTSSRRRLAFAFHPAAGSEQKGIAVVECFT
jgi:16S rRNA (guanine527-N7)-methyltransferase